MYYSQDYTKHNLKYFFLLTDAQEAQLDVDSSR